MKKLPKLYLILLPGFVLALFVALAYPISQKNPDSEVFFYLFAVTCFSVAVIDLALGLISLLFIVLTAWQKAFFFSGLILIGVSIIMFQIGNIL